MDSKMETRMLLEQIQETMKAIQIDMREFREDFKFLIDVLQTTCVGGMLPREAAAAMQQSVPIEALVSALVNASPEQQWTMLGENLYPLVEQLEHEHASKVTGMILEMDQTEVLHLLESPEALKARVAEAMDVLRNAWQKQANSSC